MNAAAPEPAEPGTWPPTPPALPLATPRLRLRAFRAADHDDVYAFQRLPEVARYLYRDPMSRDEAGAWLAAAIAGRFRDDGDALRLAVTVAPDDRAVGYAKLRLDSVPARQAELGYVIGPSHAGHGYAGEAAGAMRDLAFAALGMHRVYARIDAENTASIRVCERLGMRREAHLLENDRWNGRWGSEVIYAQLRREWETPAA